MPASTNLDAARLINDLGGVAALRKKLCLFGPECPTDFAMRKWALRGSIPTRWLMQILEQAKLEGRPVDLTSYQR